jgi:hypothetical protein
MAIKWIFNPKSNFVVLLLAREGLVLEPVDPHQHKDLQARNGSKCTELDDFQSKNGLEMS